ncbi:dihydropteroate synthase [Blattabacterium cuenoti]|uniref:dihydropteroate synthase n=1 Tax=Blattabacterium cuenoti TaxID=1653831 RepID=UPI00163BA03B|nr:dihydropteroate synthase [Blattabacterium cuenoti]
MTINCAGTLLKFDKPKIMGIVNLTPDSFYDGGFLNSELKILQYVESLIQDGVHIIDVGGCSTRPGSKIITEEEELKRVINPIRMIIKNFPKIIISIDTFRSKVVKESIESGVVIVNDISGGELDKNMYSTVSKFQVPYILNHMKGIPEYMQKNICYHKNIIIEINKYFSKKIFLLKKYGINDIILDPGFGFGKTTKQNFQLLKYINLFGFQDHLISIGISRKSMIKDLLKISNNNLLNATSIIHTIALIKTSINLIRVHDVKEASECIKITEYYKNILKYSL